MLMCVPPSIPLLNLRPTIAYNKLEQNGAMVDLMEAAAAVATEGEAASRRGRRWPPKDQNASAWNSFKGTGLGVVVNARDGVTACAQELPWLRFR